MTEKTTAIISRFAPSPTGPLHLGHAFSALTAHAMARAEGGRFLLRIEDIDQTRCRPEHEAAIFEDLAWLGISWDGEVRRQSEHMADYAAALDRLKAQGLVYPCFCTRKEIQAEIARSPSAPHGPDGALYPGTCRDLSVAERQARLAHGAAAWRLDTGRALKMLAGPLYWYDRREGKILAEPESLGDVVLARKDTPTSYHLAVTLDDALQGVNLVVRGKDLFHASHIHRLLQALLNLPGPEYFHHDLLLDAEGRRLASRRGGKVLADYRREGWSPAELRAHLGLAAE